jgi:hypothetical protein
METATATAEFTIEKTPSGWGHLVHNGCGNWTSFVDPTDLRVRWYEGTHRCGPPGTEWHTGRPATVEDHRTETPTAVAAWVRAMNVYVGTRPEELLTDDTVWPAIEELARTFWGRFPQLMHRAEAHANAPLCD